jgi:hypothetical protein
VSLLAGIKSLFWVYEILVCVCEIGLSVVVIHILIVNFGWHFPWM